MNNAQGARGSEAAGAEAGGRLLPGMARRDRAGPRGLQATHAHRAPEVCACVCLRARARVCVCAWVCVDI